MRLFSSESVSEGHPDKIADQISDAVLDAMLVDDMSSRVACETLVTTGMALVAGEVTTDTWVDIPGIVRATLARIGYDRSAYGIDAHTCAVLSTLDKQSQDIKQGVDTGGAGDQGMMFGFACDETPELMPATLVYAHQITKRMAELRKSGQVAWMRPDSKAQVTLAYDGYEPVKVHTVVVSTQHDPEVDNETIARVVRDQVVTPVLPDALLDPDDCIFHINPTGRFVIGGPHGDAGLTGRKIIVDTYGGVGRHGGGAFSGKDATKVDRSAAYAARWAAKNVVASGAASRCEIQLAYAIGVVEPVSVYVDTFGTGTVPDEKIQEAVTEVFDFRPGAIIDALGLRTPIFLPTATYGHFGRECTEGEAEIMGPRENGGPAPRVRFFPWEATDRADDLATALGL